MNSFLRLNLGLIKFLNVELKKKRTYTQLVKFILELGKAYFKEIIKLYKNLFLIFDLDYQKQKKEFEKYQQAKKDCHNAYKIIQYMINQAGNDRQERKQIRRDFEKHGIITKELQKEILRDLYGVKE